MVKRAPVLLLVILAGCVRLGFDAERASDLDLAVADQAVVVDGTTDRLLIDQADDPDQQAIPPGGIWTATGASPLSGRLWVNAAWTGKAFAVWGGALVYPDYNGSADGALYDPVTRTWTSMSTTGTLPARHTPSLVWDGTGLLVYGGAELYAPVAGGARYDPASDTWTTMSTTGSPGKRIYHLALWIGSGMFLWGGWSGAHHNDGRIYDPVADLWTPTTMTGAPSARTIFAGTWTGNEILIWGGCDGPMGGCPNLKGDGARYRPDLDKWTPISSTGAPLPRKEHTVVWTGSRMIIFGGCKDATEQQPLPDHAAYDPKTDTWTAIASVGRPADRCLHAAAWLPGLQRMVVWGGRGAGNHYTDGGLYDPVADKWEPMTTNDAPGPRGRFAYAVNDSCLFVWGGRDPTTKDTVLASGGVWCGAPKP